MATTDHLQTSSPLARPQESHGLVTAIPVATISMAPLQLQSIGQLAVISPPTVGNKPRSPFPVVSAALLSGPMITSPATSVSLTASPNLEATVATAVPIYAVVRAAHTDSAAPMSVDTTIIQITPNCSNISTLNLNTSTQNVAATAADDALQYKWKLSWLQINQHVLPFIKFNESENVSFALSKSYKQCLMYVSLRHLNQIGLFDIDFTHSVSAYLKKQFKSYYSANDEQLNELKAMTVELNHNLASRFVKLDSNQVDIYHLVNLQEFHLAYLKKKLYIKVGDKEN